MFLLKRAAEDYNESVEDKKIQEDPADVPNDSEIKDKEIENYIFEAINSESPILIYYENSGWRKVMPIEIRMTKAGNKIVMVRRGNGETRCYRLDRITKVQYNDDSTKEHDEQVHNEITKAMDAHKMINIDYNGTWVKVKPTDWIIADNTVYLNAYDESGDLRNFDIDKIGNTDMND